jgi:hypothetical protein
MQQTGCIKALVLSRNGSNLGRQTFPHSNSRLFSERADMQFAKMQGSALAVLGFSLLLLQGFLFFFSTLPAGNRTEIPSVPSQTQLRTNYIPGMIGLVALGFGGYLVVAQRKRGGNEEVQPKKTSSGFPM